MPQTATARLILASTSAYRKELLSRLRLDFETISPGVDETEAPGVSPDATALRLAREKARAGARQRPGSIVIGSDQVADCNGLRLDKPGTRDNAIRQLSAVSGQSVVFHTALCVVAETGREHTAVVPTAVRFRSLTQDRIERYVDIEQPFDCAGSAKAEGLGIALIASIEGPDPTALIGLPLIALTGILTDLGIDVP
ncbi:MAG: septum formation protein Maf [Burkholderiales bacterium]|nr:septum formation protein Maf [Burkholderiales bacterium]